MEYKNWILVELHLHNSANFNYNLSNSSITFRENNKRIGCYLLRNGRGTRPNARRGTFPSPHIRRLNPAEAKNNVAKHLRDDPLNYRNLLAGAVTLGEGREIQVRYPEKCCTCGHCVAICPESTLIHEEMPTGKFEELPISKFHLKMYGNPGNKGWKESNIDLP